MGSGNHLLLPIFFIISVFFSCPQTANWCPKSDEIKIEKRNGRLYTPDLLILSPHGIKCAHSLKMFNRMNSLFNLFVILIAFFPGFNKVQDEEITIITLYENSRYASNTLADWGFSCLVVFNGDTILFDTGCNREEFIHNITALNVSLKNIDKLVLSHNHGDHTGNVFYVLKQNPNMEVYLTSQFPEEFEHKVESLGANALNESRPVSIANGVYLSGEMGFQMKEQCLIVETSKGLVVIVGCSHPGIERMLMKITEHFGKPIYLVVGGFHTQDFTAAEIDVIVKEFKEIGVQKVSPLHCTGDECMRKFREEYGSDYIPNGTGKRISF